MTRGRHAAHSWPLTEWARVSLAELGGVCLGLAIEAVSAKIEDRIALPLLYDLMIANGPAEVDPPATPVLGVLLEGNLDACVMARRLLLGLLGAALGMPDWHFWFSLGVT